MKDTFCSYCGNLLSSKEYPKTCLACNNIIYKNPIPVVVSMILTFVGKLQQVAALVVKRNHDPKKDCWAFPGGFLEVGETWEEGSIREVYEETGIVIPSNELSIVDLFTATNGNLIIISYCWVDNLDITKFVPNEEVSELKLISKIEELAFPTHTEVLKRFIRDN